MPEILFNDKNVLTMELKDLRLNYGKGSIPDVEQPINPMLWFGDWLSEALSASMNEANAMILSTVSDKGMPSSRVVLLKGFDEKGFLFFSNYSSRKGLQIAANPCGALLFFWPELERQVRIEGVIGKAESTVSDEYFYSRPLESRVSAAVSPQSRIVPSRASLEQMHHNFLTLHQDGEFKRPENWGGYRLVPELIEFWQGRRNRLHDRIQFKRSSNGWDKSRLAP
jgi:pyridoxamine 5'-phosphate oxidase